MKLTLILIVITLFISSCSKTITKTSPHESINYEQPEKIIVNADYESVWMALTSAIVDSGYITESVSKDAGLIVTQPVKFNSLPIWIWRDKKINFKKYHYDDGTSAIKPVYPLPYGADFDCNTYSTYIAGTSLASNATKNRWAHRPSVTAENVTLVSSIKVRWVNETQTTLEFKLLPNVPVSCYRYDSFGLEHHKGVALSSRYKIGTWVRESTRRYKNFRVPHTNGFTKNVVSLVEKNCNCKSDYGSKGSIKLKPETKKSNKAKKEIITVAPERDIETQLLKLKSLLDKGLINQDEFNKKKASLLENF